MTIKNLRVPPVSGDIAVEVGGRKHVSCTCRYLEYRGWYLGTSLRSDWGDSSRFTNAQTAKAGKACRHNEPKRAQCTSRHVHVPKCLTRDAQLRKNSGEILIRKVTRALSRTVRVSSSQRPILFKYYFESLILPRVIKTQYCRHDSFPFTVSVGNWAISLSLLLLSLLMVAWRQ